MNPVEAAVEELTRTTDRMLALVSETPDDKLFWKPSAQARSIGEIVAHCAHALGNILAQMQGTPFPIPTSAEANKSFLVHDQQFSDRDALVDYFKAKRDEYIAGLQSIPRDQFSRMVTMPFGLGETPLRYFMAAGNSHTQGHIAQIEYIQTLYGDHDWHTGF